HPRLGHAARPGHRRRLGRQRGAHLRGAARGGAHQRRGALPGERLDRARLSRSGRAGGAHRRPPDDPEALKDGAGSRAKGGVLAHVIVVTSGKGGVGKTTTAAAFAAGLALKGNKTVVIDFDVGLRNLDLVMGCERRVVFDFINVINGDANLNQALIKDKRVHNLFISPPSQTREKEALKRDGVERVMEDLRRDFDYIICDSPAGIEHGALTALYLADSAIIVTNPEVSSV